MINRSLCNELLTKQKVTALVFDFETDQFNDIFRCATCAEERLKHVPRLRLGCVFDISFGTYRYYTRKTAHELIARLRKADIIISFNGKCFDLLVLQRHHRLSRSAVARLNAKHIDLCEEVEALANRKWSLDKLSKLNLGEAKHTSGRDMASLDLDALETACNSDVRQTTQILFKWLDGSLTIPAMAWRRAKTEDMSFVHHHLPNQFPHNYIDLDCDDMTEGQMAEYLAGTWGILDDENGTFVEV